MTASTNRPRLALRVLAIGLFAIYVASTVIVLVLFAVTHWGSYARADNLLHPGLGVVATPSTAYASTAFTEWNPSLDVEPRTDGSLRGALRMALQEVRNNSDGAALGIVLPLDSAVSIGDASGAVIGTISGSKANHITCDRDTYSGDHEVLEAAEVLGLWSSSTRDEWTIDCAESSMTVWYHLPESRTKGEVSQDGEGTSILTEGVGMAMFDIPAYSGLRQISFDTWELSVFVDSADRGDSVPLATALAAAGAQAKPSVSLLNPKQNLRFEDLSPSDAVLRPKPFYQLESSPSWPLSADVGAQYFTSTVVDKQAESLRTFSESAFWAIVGAAVPAIGGFVWALLKIRPVTSALAASSDSALAANGRSQTEKNASRKKEKEPGKKKGAKSG